MANEQNIDYSEKKENGPRASSAPALGLNTIIFKYVYWYMKQISGERLQDHWSSGFVGPGGSQPINFPFARPDMIEKLEANPTTREYLQDPGFRQYLQMIQKNPTAMQYVDKFYV